MLSGLILWRGSASALDAGGDVTGVWHGTVLRFRLVELKETSLQGEIDQVWVDAAGYQRQGKARFVGSRHRNTFEIFLMPTNLITLPIRIDGRLSEGKVVLQEMGTVDRDSDIQLIRSNAADYDAMIGKLSAVPMAGTLSSAPVNFTAAEARQAMQDDMEKGCQCGPQKKARVAEATVQFATEVAERAAALNDYLRGLTATWREVTKALQVRAPSQGTEPAPVQGLDGGDMRRLRLGRDSIAAYSNVFGAFRDAQLSELARLQHLCQQRNLPASAALTAEERIWADSCIWAERIHQAYAAPPGDDFVDIISLPISPDLYVVSK